MSQFPPVTPFAGMRERFGDAFRIEHERGCSSFKQTPVLDATVLDGPLQIAYYAGRERSGAPVLVEPGDRGWFTFTGPFTPEVPAEFSMRVSGTLVAPETGAWTFGLVQVGRARLAIDGEIAPAARIAEAFTGGRPNSFPYAGHFHLDESVAKVASQPRLHIAGGGAITKFSVLGQPPAKGGPGRSAAMRPPCRLRPSRGPPPWCRRPSPWC